MARRTPEVKMESYGLYTPFDKQSDDLPELEKITTEIPAVEGVEFGYILRIRKARGSLIHFTIEHPDFPDEQGDPTPPFAGSQYVRSTDYRFFLGDTLWQPIDNKIGHWRLTTLLDGEPVAEKTFDILQVDDDPDDSERSGWRMV